MMLLPSMEERIPESYYLRRLNRVLDLSFIHEAVRDKYCQDNGRPSIDPEVIMRLFLLQAITGRESIRGLLAEVDLHLGYRWFIGYGPSEALPDHSTLSKAWERFGDEVFNELFERGIQQCQASGLIEGKVLHVDATTIRADLDANRVNQPDSPDKDARFGRFPDGTLKPGYKQHTVVDGKRGVVLAVAVNAANKPDDTGLVGLVDGVTERLGQAPEVVCADAAYGSGRNRAALEARRIRLVSPPAKPFTYTGDKYFTVAEFEYDEAKDEFVCPAGERLVFIGNDAARPDRRRYRAEGSPCKVCRLKVRCTGSSRRELKVGTYHAALIRLRADSKTESFRQFYRSRAPVVEGVFAEGKQWHGLRRAQRRGLSNMKVQSLLVMTVLNLKRLATLLPLLFGQKGLWKSALGYLRHLYGFPESIAEYHSRKTQPA